MDWSHELSVVKIHVERVIGIIKQKYMILQGILPISLISSDDDEAVIDKIVRVCCVCINMCPGTADTAPSTADTAPTTVGTAHCTAGTAPSTASTALGTTGTAPGTANDAGGIGSTVPISTGTGCGAATASCILQRSFAATLSIKMNIINECWCDLYDDHATIIKTIVGIHAATSLAE